MNFYKFNFWNKQLYRDHYNDKYLLMLSSVFDEGSSWSDTVKEELLNPKSNGIGGNRTDVIIEGNKVTIQDQFTDTPEESAIIIDRTLLLDLINQWDELKAKNVQEITFIRHEDNSITMEAKF